MDKTDNNFKKYIDDFFDDLTLYDDINNGHNYKNILKVCIDVFLNNQTTDMAYEIYTNFFTIYQIKYEDKSENKVLKENEPNTLLDLVKIMKKYEENTGDLIDKQRDHFLHSVNVFLLGLAIYSQNKDYQKYFKDYIYNSPYEKYYRFGKEVSNEEFLYRWGIASLFHDIGYPVEIIGKQMKKFINDGVKSIDSSYDVNTAIDFKDFNKFNSIVKRNSDFADAYRNSHVEAKFLNMFKPTDIVAYKIYEDLKDDNISLPTLTNNLDDFVNIMGDSGFIDHGFFSSILVLNSYGYLIQKYEKKYEFFFYPIVDSASAILLHNFFRNVLLEEPYNASKLSPEKSPIAFLLILCDELQEWNRKPWGVKDKKRNHVADLIADINEDSLYVKYIVKTGPMGSNFLIEKKELIYNMLDIKSIFKDGLTIKTNVEEDNITMRDITYDEVQTPDILLKTIDKLPEQIYEYYSGHKGNFDKLEPQEQYSNIRQAKSISTNLTMIGCEITLNSDNREEYNLTDSEIKDLAMFEHRDWCQEKINAGWSPGKIKDNINLIHPLLIDWDKLEPNIQNQNIETIRNIPEILAKIDLKIVMNKTRLLSIKLHEYYNEIYSSTQNPFENLSDEDKYFNYKQSEYMIESLKEYGYDLVFQENEGNAITEFNSDEIECLAKKEHEKWCDYKYNLGWTYGPEKSEEEKTNPNICEWIELNDETREFNRNTIKNLPKLCSNKTGLKIIKY